MLAIDQAPGLLLLMRLQLMMLLLHLLIWLLLMQLSLLMMLMLLLVLLLLMLLLLLSRDGVLKLVEGGHLLDVLQGGVRGRNWRGRLGDGDVADLPVHSHCHGLQGGSRS